MILSEDQIAVRLNAENGWELVDEKWIVKRYRFRKFLDGVAFVQRVAQTAERLNHHPLIAIDYKLITLRLTSWHAGGLTELDFTAAAEFDRARFPA
ncbi:4a-hydroxytetrahydrobiopterin dehydratase [Paenibacillus sp. MBLB4367]|uniref:4a-hydroxytetrahydrobiopterin dehydratase n=1 Tax=Paenibacillus sp. MBLB4367 TaxID=3384767 RepID=UPI003907F6DB